MPGLRLVSGALPIGQTMIALLSHNLLITRDLLYRVEIELNKMLFRERKRKSF